MLRETFIYLKAHTCIFQGGRGGGGGVEIICSLLPRLNEKYFQSGCSVDLFLRRIILIFSHIIGMNYIIFHNYIIYSFIRL